MRPKLSCFFFYWAKVVYEGAILPSSHKIKNIETSFNRFELQCNKINERKNEWMGGWMDEWKKYKQTSEWCIFYEIFSIMKMVIS